MSVYFGSPTKITMIGVQQDTTQPDKVTELTVDYTNDGVAYFAAETVRGVSLAILLSLSK